MSAPGFRLRPVDGDTISVSITASMGGNEMKITYKGKVSGGTIKLTSQFPGMDGGQGQSIERTLKKASDTGQYRHLRTRCSSR